jgi:hypothetical protein
MNRHFTPDEFVDALDGVLDASRGQHLRECEACARDLAGIREALQASQAVTAPEPSPLFWDHFGARVREATLAAPAARWWAVGWRPFGALAATAGAIALVLVLNSADQTGTPSSEVAAVTPLTMPFEDDGSWSLVVGLAAELELRDVRLAAAPVQGTADLMIEDLTGEQREALARLLQKEMGEVE